MAKGVTRKNIETAFDFQSNDLLEFYLLYYNFPEDTSTFLAVCPSFNRTDYREGTTNNVAIDKTAEPFTNFGNIQQLVWQKQQYIPIAMEGEGFTVKGDNELPRPLLRFSNNNFSITKLVEKFGDLAGAKVVRKRAFAKFLDDVNFLPASNPFGAADEDAGFPDEVYFINRKTQENKSYVEFELCTSLELDNVKIPNRVGMCRYCSWSYRGYGCRYVGSPKTTFLGETLNPLEDEGRWTNTGYNYIVGDFVFTTNDGFLLRSEDEIDVVAGESIEPLKTFFVCTEAHTSSDSENPTISDKWKEDVCEKTVNACKLRFDNNLPFGGFPGTYEYNAQR